MDLVARRLRRLWRSLERKKKRDYRMKTASLIVRDAMRMREMMVVERISGDDIRIMISRYKISS
ncbi:MAG: hypothetical protein RQ885_07425 [Desulfurococcales archaeon]|jgi:hypothetical protein|nr:hypothetical protein [Desulfurococcales archaeon]